MRYIRRDKKGFTFLEILIVSGLLPLVAFAIYSTLSNGIKIWQRVSQSANEEEVNFFLAEYCADMQNSIMFSGIPFRGGSDFLTTAVLAASPRMQMITPSAVSYTYNAAQNTIEKNTFDYSAVFEQENVRPEVILRDVLRVNFQYCFYLEENNAYVWVDEWSMQDLPCAVRIECELSDGTTFSRTTGIFAEA